jgi:murein DD-endopeptidase MepM/ murein hydrolase activator NlpD
LASNHSGSAVAEAPTGVSVSGVPAVADEDEAGRWVPKQRSAVADSAIFGLAPDFATPAPDFAPAPERFAPAPEPYAPAPAFAPVPEAPAVADPGSCLLARIMDQARQAKSAVAAQKAAAEAAVRAKEAAAQKVRDDAARKKAEEVARQQAAAEAAERAEEERRAQLAVSYVKPVTCCTPASDFGGASSPWAPGNAGQDFAVPTGTPAVAIHSGVITAAGWSGSFGYRIVLSLEDGTQLWYCHLSSMVKTSGPVVTGDVIGRVGATGNATGPQLHLEVRPGGGEPVDPLEWLRGRGVAV